MNKGDILFRQCLILLKNQTNSNSTENTIRKLRNITTIKKPNVETLGFYLKYRINLYHTQPRLTVVLIFLRVFKFAFATEVI